MTPLILIYILYVYTVIVANMADLPTKDKSRFLSATVGDKVILSCFSEDLKSGGTLYWFKQSVGLKPTIITSVKKFKKSEFHGQFQHNHRFNLSQMDLHIIDVQMSDSGVYHCISRLGYEVTFVQSITLIVRDLKSELWVHQTASETVEPGRSVVLNCSVQTEHCEGQHRVHWFQQSEGSAAGVLYSHGGSSDQCESNTHSPTNSCVYNLPIHNVSSEQTGTYYCAVAACGQVLFGTGTRVNIKDGVNLMVYTLSGALAFSSVMVLVLVFSLFVVKRKYSILCSEMDKTRVFTSTNSNEEDAEADHLHYAALRIKASSSRQRNTAHTDCVYSAVQHQQRAIVERPEPNSHHIHQSHLGQGI